MKMDEWVGRLVRLGKTIKNNGGHSFVKGEVMVVTSHHRGKLCLDRIEQACRRENLSEHRVDRVSRTEVELLPKDPDMILKAIMKGAELFAESYDYVLTYRSGDKKILEKFDSRKVGHLVRITGNTDAVEIVRGPDGLPASLLLGLGKPVGSTK